MGIFKRILGICATEEPKDPGAWRVEGQSVVLDLTKLPELAPKGGAVRLEGSGLAKRLLVWRDEAGQLRALRNKCAHAGRRLDPRPGGEGVICCSVGRSTYDSTGQPLKHADKQEPLENYAVSETEGRAVVSLV